MALRMMLVSLVASLGLSLPSSSEIQRWSTSTKHWLDTQLAAWDTHVAAGTQAFEYTENSFEPAEAAGPVPHPSATPTPVVIDPKTILTEIPDSLKGVFAEAPQAEPISTPAVVETAIAAIATPVVEETTTATSAPAPAPAPPLEVTAASVPKAPKLVSNADFDNIMSEMVAVFVADNQGSPVNEPVSASQATIIASAPEAVPPSTPLADASTLPILKPETVGNGVDDQLVDELSALFASELDDIKNVEATVKTANPPAIEAEPAKVAHADAASNRNESNPASTRPDNTTPLLQAFRLTREAALAWANVLHAPAVVTIPR